MSAEAVCTGVSSKIYAIVRVGGFVPTWFAAVEHTAELEEMGAKCCNPAKDVTSQRPPESPKGKKLIENLKLGKTAESFVRDFRNDYDVDMQNALGEGIQGPGKGRTSVIRYQIVHAWPFCSLPGHAQRDGS